VEDIKKEELIKSLVFKYKNNNPLADEKLLNGFELYLRNMFSNIKNSTSKFVEKDFNSIKAVLTEETNKMLQYDITMQKKILVKDAYFIYIKDASEFIFNLALKNDKRVPIVKLREIEKKMEELIPFVQSFNIEEANDLFSEACLDIQFIENPNTEFLSLRMSRGKM